LAIAEGPSSLGGRDPSILALGGRRRKQAQSKRRSRRRRAKVIPFAGHQVP
jgi:hypothetical protein